MKKIFILLLFLLFNAPSPSAATTLSFLPNDFQYRVDLEGPIKNNTLYRIQLSSEILQKSAAEYNDIRLFASGNNETPYVVLLNEYPIEVIETYPLEIVKYNDSKAAIVMDLKLPEKYQPIRLIDIEIADRDFKKDVILYGSHNGKRWDLLSKGTVYDFSSQVDLRKTDIAFKKSDYRFYRIKLINAQRADDNKPIRLKYEGLDFSVNTIQDKKLRINGVMGQTGSKKDKKTIYDETTFTNFSSALDKNRNTVIILEAALPLDSVYFDISNPYYYRNLGLYYSDTGKDDSYRLLAQGQIYSFPLSALMETKNYIAHTTTKHKYYKFIIENKNNPQLEVKSIKFQWAQRNLYFLSFNDTAKYSLCFGNNIAVRPEYDLSSFINQNNWFRQKYEPLKTTPIRQNMGYTPKLPTDKKAKIEKQLLTIIVIILVIGIGYWLYRLIRKTGKQE